LSQKKPAPGSSGDEEERDLPPLGRVLIREKVITEDQLARALEIQKNDPQLLGQIIVALGFASEVEVLQAISKEIPIRAKLSFAITFIIWLTILILSFVILARQKTSLYRQTVRTGKVSLNYFVGDAAIPLLEDDIVRLNSLIKEAASVEGLLYAAISDRNGVVKAHSDSSLIGAEMQDLGVTGQATREDDTTYFRARLPGKGHVLILARPVIFSGVDLGRASVAISLDFIDAQIRRESLNVILLSFFIVLLGVFIAVMIGVSFSRPLAELVTATHELGKGNFKHRISMIRKHEFGDLAAAFNYMSKELWKKLKMQKSFGSYVSPEILNMIMAHPEEEWLKGRRMNVTLLFTDIRGFTAFSEDNEPEAVVKEVNRYFEIATRHIIDHGGYVDKFIGDAVLGVFGAPVARDDHAERAVLAAVAMQKEFLEGAGSEGVLLDKVGIGINSGEAVAGDLGSAVKREYSVIGDCVNIASRLNSLAKAGQIIISGSTYEGCKEAVSAAPMGSVKVKGKTHEIETYEVLGTKAGRV
jgi:adenylate cyclase